MLYQLQPDFRLEVIDKLIYGFVTYELAGMVDRKSSCNLFGRPSLFQIIYYVLPDQIILEPGPLVNRYPAMLGSGMSPAGCIPVIFGGSVPA